MTCFSLCWIRFRKHSTSPHLHNATAIPYYRSTLPRLRDILQLRFTAIFAALPAAALADISPANPLKRLARVLGYAGLRLVGNVFQPIRNRDDLHGKVWLYVVSANNYDALEFIKKARPDAVLVAGQAKNIGRYNAAVNRLSLRRKLLYYWQFPLAFSGFAAERRAGRAWRFFDFIFYAIGYYEVYRRALRHYRPRAVVFSNDHNDDTRSLLLACRAEGVPTAYVQHASVSANFPPLGFDLSLLEGQDALDKYRLCGPVHGPGRAGGHAQGRCLPEPEEHRPGRAPRGHCLQHPRPPAGPDRHAGVPAARAAGAHLHPAPPPQRRRATSSRCASCCPPCNGRAPGRKTCSTSCCGRMRWWPPTPPPTSKPRC